MGLNSTSLRWKQQMNSIWLKEEHALEKPMIFGEALESFPQFTCQF